MYSLKDTIGTILCTFIDHFEHGTLEKSANYVSENRRYEELIGSLVQKYGISDDDENALRDVIVDLFSTTQEIAFIEGVGTGVTLHHTATSPRFTEQVLKILDDYNEAS